MVDKRFVTCVFLWIFVVCGPEIVFGMCTPQSLAMYKVMLKTEWSEEKFPKQYPQFRPHAQWARTIGRSHNSRYVLWRVGEQASDAMRQYAETGELDMFESDQQGSMNMLDEFYLPPIDKGVGRADAIFFVDGNHSRISLMTRMVPSPDWFIGIDSLDLCSRGRWIDSMTIDLDPMDSGTDDGFTFTAPNWETEPKGKISRITAKHPNHPANSFYYPNLMKLPLIAQVKVLRLREYSPRISWSHHDYLGEEEFLRNKKSQGVDLRDLVQEDGPMEGLEYLQELLKEQQRLMRNRGKFNSYEEDNEMDEGRGSGYVEDYPEYGRRLAKKHHGGPARPCKVSQWSQWSECSVTCGLGQMVRQRHVVSQPKHGGIPCPTLREAKWCGSSRNCREESSYFNW